MSFQGASDSIFGFDPRSIGGCLVWLDGADATTLFSDTGGTTLSTVGGAVRRWKDKSGQGNDFSNRSANTSVYFPTRVSGGGISIPNAGAPNYNSGTYVCIQSVNGFLTFPYYTIYTVANTSSTNPLPSLFVGVRVSGGANERSPQWGIGGSFTLGTGSSNAPFNFGTIRQSVGDANGQSRGEQIPSGVTTIMGFTSGRLSNTMSVAGTRRSSQASTVGSPSYIPFTTCPIGPYQGGWFNTVNGTDNRWYNGNIYETLVFNSELTLKQCEEIEGYLSWKWGRQTGLPTAHPFRLIAPLARGFTPIDIPGCQLWLDGLDPITWGGGSTISTWLDKSGSGNTATSGSGTIAAGGGGGLTFDGTKYMTVAGLAGALANTSFVIFFVESFTGSGGYYFGDDNVNSGGATDSSLHVGYRSQTNHTFAFYANDLEDYNVSGSGVARIMTNWLPTPLNRVTRRNGAIDVTLGNSNRLTSFTAPRIGRVFGGNYYTGTIYEIIIYRTDIGLQNVIAVEGYLAQKWGLRVNLPATHSFKTIPPSAVQQFKPTDVNACSLWLDAADPAATGTGATVTTWLDKSGNGSNATANSAITLLSNAVNGNTVLSVSSGTPQWLLGNISIRGTGLTVISAFRMDSGSSPAVRIIGLAATGANDYNSSDYVGILRQGSSNMGAYRANVYAGPLLTYGVPAISTSVFNGTTAVSTINGGTSTASFGSTANFVISSYAVLANTNTADTHYLSGYMCEMIVYNTTLTNAQIQQVEGYLSKKWAIPLVTTHPYYAINPAHMVGGTGIITPSNLPGLLVWNRGDTLAGANGSTVGTWTNSGNASGPTISCSGTQSNAALNGRNVVNFTTAQTWTSSAALTPTSFTFIHLERQVAGTNGRVFQASVAGANHLHGYWNNFKKVWYNEGWLTVDAGVSSAQYEWSIVTGTRVAGGAFECRWNGATISEGTTSSGTNLGGLAVNTGGLTGGETSTCQIAEVILYNSVLTKSQLFGIEEYLRQKWGLGVN